MNPQDDVTLQARALPRSVPPPRDLWPEIEARLDEYDSKSAPRGSISGQRPRRWQPLALAAGLLLAVSVGFWLGRVPDSSMPAATTAGTPNAAPDTSGPAMQSVGLLTGGELRQTRMALARDIEQRLEALTPTTREVVLDNLAVINQALDDIDAALDASPDSDLDARLLMAMYADQLVLLNSMNNALYPATAEIAL